MKKMTHKERLESIEIIVKYHLPNFEYTTPHHPLKTEAIEYLINRVKVLTEALEFYSSSIDDAVACGECIADDGVIARKALDD